VKDKGVYGVPLSPASYSHGTTPGPYSVGCLIGTTCMTFSCIP
jgi:hypothetical protein